MDRQGQSIAIENGERHAKKTRRMFNALIGRFDKLADQKLMGELGHWVEETYGEEFEARPSKHVYLRLLPA